MATCVNCGKAAGLLSNRHSYCERDELTSVPLMSVRIGDIVSGVFWGMWLFTASAIVVGLIVRVIILVATGS